MSTNANPIIFHTTTVTPVVVTKIIDGFAVRETVRYDYICAIGGRRDCPDCLKLKQRAGH